MRNISSCSSCRSRKKRCIVASSDKACRLCLSKGYKCNAPILGGPLTISGPALPLVPTMQGSLNSSSHPASLTPGSQTSHETTQSDATLGIVQATLNSQSLCDELIDIYFKVIHYKQHLLFHRASFVLDHKAGLIPRYLVLGIIVLSARFSSHPSFDRISPWDRGEPVFREAIRSFDQRKKLINIQSLQGCILLAFCALTIGDPDRDALLSCQAIRVTQALDLPKTLSSNGLIREVEINLYWQTWMMDCWTSVRTELPQQLLNDASFPKPLQEDIFNRLKSSSPLFDLGNCYKARAESIWGLILPITQWHAQTVRLNSQTVKEPSKESNVADEVHDLTIKLDQWVQNLPLHLQNTEENFRRQLASGYGKPFVVMHVIYHHTCQSLFYQFLAKCASRVGNTMAIIDERALRYSELCKFHAIALSKLMWGLNIASDMDCLWSPVNSHLLVIASTIHLRTMLLELDKAQVTEAKKHLERNFIILQELQKYWPSTELAFSRLKAFHNACRVSSISKTFDMDQWMVKFLNRYDLSVEDRDLDVELADLGASNTGDELWGVVFGSNLGQ